ncbi:DUF4011 domain-containing protein [Myroides sp.]|uniref:DUF4011 domain-containing protein n=1 Tax=Myroides sp. TaxID=1874736 RepID=UPI003F33DF36
MEQNTPIKLSVQKYSYFNYTFCIQKYHFIQRILIENQQESYEGVKVVITSQLGFFEDNIINIERLDTDTAYTITKFDFKYNLHFIRNVVEKDIDTVQIALMVDDEVLVDTFFQIEVLPIDYFGGLELFPQLLASYILPNHDVIYPIKSNAIRILEKNKLVPSFEGYQSGSRERVLQMISAIYRSIQSMDLVYSALPPSYERTGQRIRLLDQVIETKFGNCMDITLLFAACLEAIDLHPILILTRGHIFVGVWLVEDRFDSMVNYDQTAVTKRAAVNINELIVIESTMVCKGATSTLKEAMASAEAQLIQASDFILSIDVKTARINNVLPLPVYRKSTGEFVENHEFDVNKRKDKIDKRFDQANAFNDLELGDGLVLSKQRIWERKLLDLSLRNNLLNTRFTKSILQLIDVNVNELEDSLADGKTYTIQGSSQQEILNRYNLYFPPLHSSEELYEIVNSEFKHNRLYSYYNEYDLENILVNLHRNSRLAEEENGKSTLYLGIGLLKWFEPKSDTTVRYAPILLVPVELNRRSINSKFALRSRGEETMINITLLEYLRQEFKLDMTALEDLPMDDSGVDVPKVLALVRKTILDLKGWDVLDQVILGTFSFNKLILWQDISKYADKLQKSTIVNSLLNGNLSESLDTLNSNDEELEQLSAAELTLPISTDNSQLEAVRNAHANRSFVLHGPPGTGKSQTITNIIADALANGKKVLFVAAKKAALDVVHSRLEKIGLGPFCLELHSNKTRKSDVLAQFEATLEVPRYKGNYDFKEASNRIDERKAELRKYITQLHQRFNIGWSLYDTIAYLELNQVSLDNDLLVNINLEDITQSTYLKWTDWLIQIASLCQRMESPMTHPLRALTIKEHKYDIQTTVKEVLSDYKYTAREFEQISAEYNFRQLTDKRIDANSLQTLFELLGNSNLSYELIDLYFDANQFSLLHKWIELQQKSCRIEDAINQNFNKKIVEIDLSVQEQEWNKAKHLWFLPKWFKQRKVKSFLNGYSKVKVKSEHEVNQLFIQIEDFKAAKQSCENSNYKDINRLSHIYYSNDRLDFEAIYTEIENLSSISKLAQQSGFYGIDKWLLGFYKNNNVRRGISEVTTFLKTFIVKYHDVQLFSTSVPSSEEVDGILANLDKLNDWINYNVYKDKGSKIGLSWYIDLLEQGKIGKNNLDTDLERILHINLFIKTVSSSFALSGFDAKIYETLIKQYQDIHSEYTELNKSQLVLKLSNRIPRSFFEFIQSSELGMLKRAIRSRGRGLSLRKLFDQMPNLISRLKPCMLMSPISVAQYFDVSTEHFDLVIFDEASQLPTAEAISALARAKQAIIVGDPKQMPPTSFFASNKVDEDNLELEDLESILDDCLALSIPSKYLLRHYRSKHESLISFSNANFYDNKLLTFPSKDDLDKKVTFEFIEGGVYEKGKSRTNKKEATAVVEYIKQHYSQIKPKSLGVVTFSQTQQTLIEDMLADMLLKNPAIEETILGVAESLFIKNLENVQGDERDIILFSIGYGPDEEGKVSMNFGPLNRDGGWRRLNVAVTRARYEMKIFSSIKGEHIDLRRTNSEGVKGLKNFLDFADKGYVNVTEGDMVKQNDKLIQAIATYLKDNGFDVRTNIGTSSYRLDIGVVDKNNPNEYVLGILVDGFNYFNAKTTNDRELLIPGVLKGLGWNIYRIWTIDWFKNKEFILKDLQAKIDAIYNQVEVEQEEVSPMNFISKHLVEVTDKVAVSKQRPYEALNLNAIADGNSETIYLGNNRNIVQNQLYQFIQTEGPISQTYLFKKMMNIWNISRTGTKLQAYLVELVNEIPNCIAVNSYQEFYWNDDLYKRGLSYYRENASEKRNIEDICPEEIELAIIELLESNFSVPHEDLTKAIGKVFDFSKLGSQMDQVIQHVIQKMLVEDKIINQFSKIILKDS